jgi:DNA-binding MarR family transcriptional regulator
MQLHLLSSKFLVQNASMNNKLCENSVRAWSNLVRAEAAVLVSVENDIKQAGFPPLVWYDLLLELKKAENHRLRPFELEERVLLRQYNLSRLIDRMETDQLVQRIRCKTDARGLHIALMPKGHDLLKRMWPIYAEAIYKHFAAKLAIGEHEQLADLLQKVTDKNRHHSGFNLPAK